MYVSLLQSVLVPDMRFINPELCSHMPVISYSVCQLMQLP
jgi:hypothetical protein